jgi:hypothetical protein
MAKLGKRDPRNLADPVDLIVTEFAIAGGTALDVCQIAATAASSPSVLVMRPAIARVPDLIEAGCDGILLTTRRQRRAGRS